MPELTKVLLVDDEPLVLDSTRELIRRDGRYDVHGAESGKKALELVAAEHYAVIVMDLMLADMNGIEVLKSVKELAPDTQVIMVSGKGTINQAVEAMKIGAFDFLTKPYSPPHFLQILDRASAYHASLVENRSLKNEIRRLKKNYEIVGTHSRIKRINEIIENIAPSDSTVMIQGKSGTGKELVARAIHDRSNRADGPFQAVNCGVFAETLIENELFGHEKGAYTGAVQRAIGRIEAADKGTLFLDEIDTMPLSSQVKLLRVIEERCFQRIGGTKTVHVDFRLIAATNVDLREAVALKKFRDDLYYRLHVISISLPELAERKSDIPLLVQHFLKRSYGSAASQSVAPEAMELLMAHRWPGNVRELVNAVEYAVVMAKGRQITLQDLPESILQRTSSGSLQPQPESMSLRETEKDLIMRALRECRGNKHLAAKVLRIPRSTLYSKIQKHRIELAGNAVGTSPDVTAADNHELTAVHI